jgi:hypothetical protein
MRFARFVFFIAGVWGILILTPLYFAFDVIGRQYPPPITHADFYYGFLSVALVWQIAFFVIGSDPGRFRPMMIVAVLEKFGYMATLGALYAQSRMQGGQVALASPDLVLGVLFVVAFVKTSTSRTARH